MKVLITAGMVYGRLDDNKFVGNRSRGLWASGFAEQLAEEGHEVTYVVADNYDSVHLADLYHKNIKIVKHNGYYEYASICESLAPDMDAAVMASAVVNWIPANPIKGKMPTAGYKEGDIIDIPFVLAPRVINKMRTLNPRLTLIGCKMLAGKTEQELEIEAHHVLDAAKCHVVVANDLTNLKQKYLIYPDHACIPYNVAAAGFYEELQAIIEDQHYKTEMTFGSGASSPSASLFDKVAVKYRGRFTPVGDGRVFGAIAVKTPQGWLVSGRRKDQTFTSTNAELVKSVDHERRVVTVVYNQGQGKASMNAPLLIRFGEENKAEVVLHLHETLKGATAQPYAPPGTKRDTMRVIPKALDIEGHGFIAALDGNLEIIT